MKPIQYLQRDQSGTHSFRGTIAKGNSGGVIFNNKNEAVFLVSTTSDAGITRAYTVPQIKPLTIPVKTDSRSLNEPLRAALQKIYSDYALPSFPPHDVVSGN